jgi:hypothetical protein
MKITDVTLTRFARDNLPATTYVGAARPVRPAVGSVRSGVQPKARICKLGPWKA